MAIILDHVNHIYDADTAMAHAALKDVCLQIPDGQFIGLIGHTGSGKSTLIQHLNGIVKPTSGNVYYNGKDIHDKEYDRKIRGPRSLEVDHHSCNRNRMLHACLYSLGKAFGGKTGKRNRTLQRQTDVYTA